MPISKDQYECIKEYVLSCLKSTESFSLSPHEFCEKFNLLKPFYIDLVDRVKKDDMPFHTEGKWKDSDGDPSDPIIFSRK